MILESALNRFNSPLWELDWEIEVLSGILRQYTGLDEVSRRKFSVRLNALQKIRKNKINAMTRERISRVRELIGRIRKLSGYLQTGLPDEKIRAEYQVQINHLKLELERHYPDLKIIFNPENKLLIFTLGRKIINAIGGPMGERNYNQLKGLLHIELNEQTV